jgi:predicted metal-binding membrane protein
MSSSAAAVPVRPTVRRWVRRYPEWWLAVPVAAAWVWLLAGPALSGPAGNAGHSGHGAQHLTPAGWTAMTLAMMLPITAPAVRHVARNSYADRRARAMTLFTVGYLVPWLAYGGLLAAAVWSLSHLLPGLLGMVMPSGAAGPGATTGAGLALAVAGGWQLGRTKRRAINTCRRTVPLPPQGRRADLACLRFGTAQAWRCLRSCWALMAAMTVVAVAGHGILLFMIAATGLVLAEELTRAGQRLRPLSGTALLVASAGVLLVGGP